MKPTIFYATTDDGSTLPIIDVTHPAFAVLVSDDELDEKFQQFIADAPKRAQMPPEILEALKRSKLGSALGAASGSFLTGLNTYRFKLGPDHFGEDEHMDRAIAASPPALSMRIRLQDMARFLAYGLSAILPNHPKRPVAFINIAGGPAPDVWNALIHLRKTQPHLLVDREIDLHVLDLDHQGPSFGARALETLCNTEAPLCGLKIRHQHLNYDWSQTERLPEILTTLRASESACAISSEGGLFEYGSDEEIIANLKQLHAGTPDDAFIAGTVTRDSEVIRAAHGNSAIKVRPRTLEAFCKLAEAGGWSIHQAIERPMSYNLSLMKSEAKTLN